MSHSPGLSARVTAVVGVLALAVFMSSLDLFIVNLAFPYISRQYPGTSLSSLSWVLNAYTIVFAAVLVPAGRWADRIGRRRLFVAGLAGFTAGSVLCGLAPGVGLLIAARVVQAAGAGAMVPASLSLLLAAVPAQAPGEGAGYLVGAGRAGGGARPGDRRQPGPDELALGVLDQRAGRGGRRDAGRPGGAGEPGCGVARPAGPGRGGAAGGVRRAWSRTRWSRRRAGAGARPGSSACWPPRWPAARPWSGGRGGITRRSSSWSCCGRGRSAARSRASILYYAGFGAFVLSAVEFLTGVWRYSAVDAGLAIAPGPLMVLPFARLVAPRLAAFLGGPGRVAVIGCLVNAACAAGLAGPDPGGAGLRDPPAARAAAGRRRGGPDHPLAARGGQRVADAGAVRHRERDPRTPRGR